jgi:hypothetical protein
MTLIEKGINAEAATLARNTGIVETDGRTPSLPDIDLKSGLKGTETRDRRSSERDVRHGKIGRSISDFCLFI